MNFEDEDISHLQDPETGEINKDNFVSYSLERKLLDAQETSARRKRMKKESIETSRKERMLRRQTSFITPPAQIQDNSTAVTQTNERFVKLIQILIHLM